MSGWKNSFFKSRFMKNCKKSDFYSACWCTTIWHKMHMTAGNIIKETSTIIIILMMIKEQKPSRCLCWDVVRNSGVCFHHWMRLCCLLRMMKSLFVPQLRVSLWSFLHRQFNSRLSSEVTVWHFKIKSLRSAQSYKSPTVCSTSVILILALSNKINK